MKQESTTNKILSAYRQWVADWIKWETGHTSLFTEEPKPLPLSIKVAISNVDSDLYQNLYKEVRHTIKKGGVEALELMMDDYFSSYFEIQVLVETGKLEKDIAELLSGIGRTFLQYVSDIALRYGIDETTIDNITGLTPRGAGVVTTAGDTIQGCQAGNDALISSIDEGVCNLDISKQIKNQPQLSDILPEILRTEEAIPIFQKAVDTGLVDINGKKLKWNRTKSMLAYFMGHFFVNGVFPDTIYSSLFDVQRLGQAYYRLADNKHGEGGKPRGYEEIDKLFE